MSDAELSVLIDPYGGTLVDLTTPTESYEDLKAYASQLPSIQISPRSVCDLELLATGALSPLDQFMRREDFQGVLDDMRLADGHLFPIPVSLPVEPSPDLRLGKVVALRNNEFELVAIMTIEDVFEWDRVEVAEKIIGTQDFRHPLVAEMQNWGSLNIAGRLQVLNLPRHYDFEDLWLSPSQTRSKLTAMERENVVAYQPQNYLQKLSRLLIEQSLKDVDGTLLLHPAVGLTRLGDINHYTRIRIYKTLAERYFKPDQILLSILPLATRMAGLREILWQALIRRNYGANHMIVNLDHASSGISTDRKPYFGSIDAQQHVERYSLELGVKMMLVSEEDLEGYSTSNVQLDAPNSPLELKARYPKNGSTNPDLNNLPEIAEIMALTDLPRHHQGVCIWFTGLSGSGKSTTAEMLTWILLDHGRRVSVLDGDVVRTHLSKGLGFSKTDRDTNIRRIGFVAAELVRFGGIVICAVVSPYHATRNDVRSMVGKDQFVEVYVDTPLEICEIRDVKGLYAKARRGELKGFTGIDDPYEPPDHPEIILNTVDNTPRENANLIIKYLTEQAFIQSRQKRPGL